jgi:hypothetical protein
VSDPAAEKVIGLLVESTFSTMNRAPTWETEDSAGKGGARGPDEALYLLILPREGAVLVEISANPTRGIWYPGNVI